MDPIAKMMLDAAQDTTCVNCKLKLKTHVNFQCLFEPTTYKAMSRLEELVRQPIDVDYKTLELRTLGNSYAEQTRGFCFDLLQGDI